MDKTSNVTEEFVKESDVSLNAFTYGWLVILTGCCCALQYVRRKKKSDLPVVNNIAFISFQRNFYAAYFLALFGDWLQGPYIYKLYKHYGFTNVQIAVLYVVGFSASVFFGTGTGVLADRFGRKKMCMLFSLTYSLCCFMKISTNYNILLLGRLLGGVSTSLLFSVFESWYIHEHKKNYFEPDWIPITFSEATFWNGVMAIIAGILANFTAETLGFGPVSPFLLAIPCFVVSCIIMLRKWPENYGERRKSLKASCGEGLRIIFSSKLIFLLGIVQSLFECVMYVFVFLWTPILDTKHPPLGIVFAVFMLCIMIGCSVYEISLYKKTESHYMLLLATVLAVISQCGCALATSFPKTNVFLAFISFLILEVAVGIYYPSIGFIKSEYVPETYRANIMNWYRVPLNVIICIILISFHGNVDSKGNFIVFLLCAGMMLSCAFIMIKIIKIIPLIDRLPQYT